jgi:hypothetical protein
MVEFHEHRHTNSHVAYELKLYVKKDDAFKLHHPSHEILQELTTTSSAVTNLSLACIFIRETMGLLK